MKEILVTLKYLASKRKFTFSLKEINRLLFLNKKLFQEIDKKLNEEFSYGFNLHGSVHLKRVFLIAKNLLKIYRFKINSKTLAVSLLYHDLGNLIERKNHHYHSLKLLENFFKIARVDLEEEKILTSIYVHELAGLKDLTKIKLLEEFYKNNKLDFKSFKEFSNNLKKVLRSLSYETKILFISDNLDIGFHRLPLKKFPRKDFWLTEKDYHILLNALWRFEKIEQKNQRVFLKFVFNPYLKKTKIKNKEIYELVAKGKRIYFPQALYEIYKIHHLSFFDISLSLLFHLYRELIYLFIFLNDLSPKELILNFKDERGVFEKNIYLQKTNFDKSLYEGIILPFRLHKINP